MGSMAGTFTIPEFNSSYTITDSNLVRIGDKNFFEKNHDSTLITKTKKFSKRTMNPTFYRIFTSENHLTAIPLWRTGQIGNIYSKILFFLNQLVLILKQDLTILFNVIQGFILLLTFIAFIVYLFFFLIAKLNDGRDMNIMLK
jgi:hypothetical protein